jgi:hypothetical protein
MGTRVQLLSTKSGYSQVRLSVRPSDKQMNQWRTKDVDRDGKFSIPSEYITKLRKRS